jgi:hypothetical protein
MRCCLILAFLITLNNGSLANESNILGWKRALPGTRAYLDDDGGGANTATVCNTADRYRDWLKMESAPGCHAFQHGLRVVIEVVLLDAVRDTEGTMWRPLVKINIPSRNFTGYCNLDILHPEVPVGTKVHFTPVGNSDSNRLYKTAEADEKESIELGPEISATVLSYDPTDDSKLELHVSVDDGPNKGKTGWMLSFLGKSDDGQLIDQFDQAVRESKIQ